MSEPARSARQVSRPPMPGMFISSSTRLGISRGTVSSASSPVRASMHLVAVAHQRGLHHAADLRIVVHHQDFSGAQFRDLLRPRARPARRAAKSKTPSPGPARSPPRSVRRALPRFPWRSPVPCPFLWSEAVLPAAEKLVEDPRCARSLRCPDRDRRHRSRSSHSSAPPRRRSAILPANTSAAFSMNCFTTCSTNSGSASAAGRSCRPRSPSTGRPLSAAANSAKRARDQVAAATGRFSRCSLPASMRAMAITSAASWFSRSASSLMMVSSSRSVRRRACPAGW